MNYFVTASLLFSCQLMAATPAIEFKQTGECATEAAQVMVRYTELFDLGADVSVIRFDTYRNTTQGSFNQEYEAEVSLVHDREIDEGVDTTRLFVTFSSPFICDDLKILKIEPMPSVQTR